MNNGIKSKDRVKSYGEVFTPDSIVNDMLDLVDENYTDIESITENNEYNGRGYIDKTYLEPACGDGQFLIRILYRKMLKVKELPVEQRANALIRALASIYAIDIQMDNIGNIEDEKSNGARNRMYALATGEEVKSFDFNNKMNILQVSLDIEYTDKLIKAIKFVLNNNIICGDALKGKWDKDEVTLICYHFNNNKVSIAYARLNSLDDEQKRTNEVDILDISTLDTNDVVDDYNF